MRSHVEGYGSFWQAGTKVHQRSTYHTFHVNKENGFASVCGCVGVGTETTALTECAPTEKFSSDATALLAAFVLAILSA